LKNPSKKTPYDNGRAVNETSAGAVVFLVRDKKIKVLLLVRNNAFFGIESKEVMIDIGPKGHVEKGESIVHAANREIREEIGMPLHIDMNFKEVIKYSFTALDEKAQKQKKIKKEVVFFLAFMDSRDAKKIYLSGEHTKYYIVPIEEAIDQVAFQNQKEVLEKANEYIRAHYLT